MDADDDLPDASEQLLHDPELQQWLTDFDKGSATAQLLTSGKSSAFDEKLQKWTRDSSSLTLSAWHGAILQACLDNRGGAVRTLHALAREHDFPVTSELILDCWQRCKRRGVRIQDAWDEILRCFGGHASQQVWSEAADDAVSSGNIDRIYLLHSVARDNDLALSSEAFFLLFFCKFRGRPAFMDAKLPVVLAECFGPQLETRQVEKLLFKAAYKGGLATVQCLYEQRREELERADVWDTLWHRSLASAADYDKYSVLEYLATLYPAGEALPERMISFDYERLHPLMSIVHKGHITDVQLLRMVELMSHLTQRDWSIVATALIKQPKPRWKSLAYVLENRGAVLQPPIAEKGLMRAVQDDNIPAVDALSQMRDTEHLWYRKLILKAVMTASMNGFSEIVLLLIKRFRSIVRRDAAILAACAAGRSDMLQYLREHNQNYDVLGQDDLGVALAKILCKDAKSDGISLDLKGGRSSLETFLSVFNISPGVVSYAMSFVTLRERTWSTSARTRVVRELVDKWGDIMPADLVTSELKTAIRHGHVGVIDVLYDLRQKLARKNENEEPAEEVEAVGINFSDFKLACDHAQGKGAVRFCELICADPSVSPAAQRACVASVLQALVRAGQDQTNELINLRRALGAGPFVEWGWDFVFDNATWKEWRYFRRFERMREAYGEEIMRCVPDAWDRVID